MKKRFRLPFQPGLQPPALPGRLMEVLSKAYAEVVRLNYLSK